MDLFKKSLLIFFIALLHFSLARLGLLFLYPKQFADLSFLSAISALVVGIRFDLSSVAVFFSIPLLLMNLPLKLAQHRFWQRFLTWVIYIGVAVAAAVLIGDLVYFDYVKRHTTYELFLMGEGDTQLMGEMIFTTFLPYLFVLLADILVVFWLFRIIDRYPVKSFNSFWWRTGQLILIFLLLVTAGRGGFGDKPVTIIDAFNSGNTNYGNLVLNGVFSISHSALKGENINHHFFPDEQALQILQLDRKLTHPDFPFQKEIPRPPKKRLNLVIVLIESLSVKYVDSFAGLNYGVTPNLDQLAENGLRFINFYASGQRSVEGIQATLTGIPSIIGLPTIGIGITANYSKLGNLAADNGYDTIFVSSLKRRSFRIDAIAGSAGFKRFYGKEDIPILLDYPDPDAARWGWDYETYMFAAEQMEKSKKPFLTYILTSTTHTPYPRLPKGLEKYPHHQSEEEGFLNTVNYTDWSIKQFMDRLRKQPWFDDTIFIFTADHALAHYQSGGLKDRFQIPLIIYAPKLFKPATIKQVGSQVDIFTTIVETLTLKGKYSSAGDSLLNQKTEPFAFVREGSIMGIITEKGFLRHSLKNRLEVGVFAPPAPAGYFDKLEQKLLAMDQITYQSLTANRWAE
jgi:phosphoglycerol transferase MdoB-like AlkP superfamily enzyme